MPVRSFTLVASFLSLVAGLAFAAPNVLAQVGNACGTITGSEIRGPGNDAVFFSGSLTQLNQTFVNPYDGTTFTASGTYNVNQRDYDSGEGFDTMLMSSQNDVLCIRSNSNTQAVLGVEVFTGGGGQDLLIFADSSFTYEIETIVSGGSGPDVIWGNTSNEILVGSPGDDLVNGGPGRDQVTGNDDNDTLFGGEGDDQVEGGRGDDVSHGGPGNDLVDAQRFFDGQFFFDADTVYAGADQDTVWASDFDALDVIDCGDGDDVVFADPGDTLAANCETTLSIGYPVLNYDAALLLNRGADDFDRVAAWPDAGANGIDATSNGKDARRARLYGSFAPMNGEPVVHFNGTKHGLAIPKSDSLFGTNHPQKTVALAFRTSDRLTGRQVLFELGGAESGLNAYLDGDRLYVGAWSQAGLPSDWGPHFLNVTVQARTAYVLVLTHRRDTESAPGRFEAYLNGERIGLVRPATNTFARTSDNGGIGRVVGTTRYHDGVSASGALAFAKVNVGQLVHTNHYLFPDEVGVVTAELAHRFGIALAASPSASRAARDASRPAWSGLLPPYPNPMQDHTTVRYQLAVATAVDLSVFDALGRRVSTLATGIQPAGLHTVQFERRGLASGVYVVRLQAAGRVTTMQVTLLR